MNFRNAVYDVLVRMTSLFPCVRKSHDLTPCDFFFRGHVKNLVSVPSVSKETEKVRERITAALVITDNMALQNEFDMFNYHLDVCTHRLL